jgi:hypothetical protein
MMPPPVVADHVPPRAPRGARGGASSLLGDAMGEGLRDTAVMRQGSVTMMYGRRLRNRRRCCCF